MRLFLCSHFSSVGSAVEEQIAGKKVLFIPTASIHEGYTGYVGSARKLFKKAGALLTETDISTEEFSKIKTLFDDADVIYFTGGNSFFLIDYLRKTGTDKLLKRQLEKGNLSESRQGRSYVRRQFLILRKWTRFQRIIRKATMRD